MSKKILTKGEILTKPNLARELIEVEEWGGSIYISELTGKQVEYIYTLTSGMDKNNPMNVDVTAKVLALAIVDESGERVFTTDEEIEFLENQPISVLNRLSNEFMRINKLRQQDLEEAKKNLKNQK